MDQISAVSIIQRMNTKCDPDIEQLVELLSLSLQTPGVSHLADSVICATAKAGCPTPVNSSNVVSHWFERDRAVVATMAQRNENRRRFSPSLAYGRHFGPPLPTARPAAVMILIEQRQSGWAIPLTVRPHHLPDHPGQVCLPGGRLEPGEDVIQAAEREFCEELGLAEFPAETLGELQSIYVYNSNFYLTPCVAVIDRELDYQASPAEVESIVYLPLEHLWDLNRHVVLAHSRGTLSWSALGIESDGTHVWGATAIVLGELAAILQPLVGAST
jgi:8-oxo-dGTP pyrophosphatase MutT (NUDIX family)